MEFKTTKEFIVQAHSAACTDWKKRIEKEFPEAFETQLEIGKWYVLKNEFCDWLMNYQGDGYVCYGFNSTKDWNNYYIMSTDKGWREATHEEIESALISEAKKRGYKKGVTCVFGALKNKRTISTNEIKWDAYWADKGGLCMGMDIIFTDGKWEEIIPEEKTTISKEKALKIIAKKLKVSPENILIA